jgi:hypothetical protein
MEIAETRDVSPSGTLCAACGAERRGTFCCACGQRRPRPEDESLWHFLREGFAVVTSADGKLWRSARGLFVPGKLTADHFAGRRSLYLHPVRLFLILNVVFFFVLSGAGGSVFRGPLSSHTDAGFYGPLARQVSERQAEAWATPEAYETAFDQQADTLAPTLIALLVPVVALALGLVLLPARASGVRHLVFATHTVAAIMATTLLLIIVVGVPVYVAALLGYRGALTASLDIVLEPLAILCVCAYFVLGVRRAYGVPWWGATLSGLAVASFGMYAALVAFRVSLFFMTVWTLDAPAA